MERPGGAPEHFALGRRDLLHVLQGGAAVMFVEPAGVVAVGGAAGAEGIAPLPPRLDERLLLPLLREVFGQLRVARDRHLPAAVANGEPGPGGPDHVQPDDEAGDLGLHQLTPRGEDLVGLVVEVDHLQVARDPAADGGDAGRVRAVEPTAHLVLGRETVLEGLPDRPELALRFVILLRQGARVRSLGAVPGNRDNGDAGPPAGKGGVEDRAGGVAVGLAVGASMDAGGGLRIGCHRCDVGSKVSRTPAGWGLVNLSRPPFHHP